MSTEWANTLGELASALIAKKKRISISDNLAAKVRIFKKLHIGPVAWAIAVGSIIAAIGFAIGGAATAAPTAGGGAVLFGGSAVAAGTAVTILGVSATYFLVALGVSAGSIALAKQAIDALHKDYDLTGHPGTYALVRRARG